MTSHKPTASLSLDLDNKWSYMKTHGDAGWETFPSYLDVVVPRVLDFLKARDLTITFFIVGKDAAQEKNKDALRAIADAGHEIASHSFHHEVWLDAYSEQQIESELVLAEEQIAKATGRKPVGFRGPGFSFSHATLRALARRGYLYDASSLPTYLGPLLRAYFFLTSKLSKEEKSQRASLFGSFRDGLRPNRPHWWRLGTSDLLEIPVTTMPVPRLPIHFSYVIFMSAFSRYLGLVYFWAALKLCRLTGTQPSLLLHPLDFLGREDTSDLAFFPGMNLPREKKLRVVSDALGLLSSEFRIRTMQEHAQEAFQTPNLAVVDASLQQPPTKKELNQRPRRVEREV
jgi:peptidoglycan/xylan/chitin deacetylase (PgdA/CDA1 family)